MTGTAARLVRGTVAFDRARLDGRAGLRAALGVALPLLVGLLLDRPLDGAAAAGGAFFAGFAAFAAGYRTRVSTVLLATAGIALSTFVGAAVGDTLALLVPTVALWGFAAGLLVALGIAPGIIGIQSVIGLLVITQYSMPLEDAAGRAALVAVGGLVQALLVVAIWPLRRSPVERRAMAEVYRSLAAYATALPERHGTPPDGGPLAVALAALGDPQPFARGDGVLAFQGLHDEAERMRTILGALAQVRASLAAVPVRAAAVGSLDAFVFEAGNLLAQVATAVEKPRLSVRSAALLAAGPHASPARWARLDAGAAALAGAGVQAGPARAHLGPSLLVQVDELAHALLASLRAVVRLSGGPAPLAEPPRQRIRSPFGQDALSTLRANLTLRSAAYRHALRLGVTLGVGTAVAGQLPFEHRYWLPLTALVVLRPDFTSTFTRGLSRILGTALGALVATGVAAALQPGPYLLALLVALTAWASYAVIFANYALYGLFVTGFVVFLLSFTGLPGGTTLVDRIEATLLGGALALLAYALWPTWERVRVNEQLARLLEAQERYGSALLRQYADPLAHDPAVLQDLRAASRLARINAEASVGRVNAEPGRARVGPVDDISAATRRYALAALALQAHLPQAAVSLSPEPLQKLAFQQQETVRELAAALRTGRAPGELPALRATQQQLRRELDQPWQDPRSALDAAVLDVEVDQLVGSVLTVAEQLARLPALAEPRRSRLRPAYRRVPGGGG